MAKKTAYTIRTDEDTIVDTRTERPAAVKLADKLAAETGVDHYVFTPAGKATHTSMALPVDEVADEIAEEIPQDDVPEAVQEIEEAAPEADEEEASEDFADVLAEVVTEDTEDDAPAEDDEDSDEVESAAILPYAAVMASLDNADPAIARAAKTEWERRQGIYRERTNAKDASERIVGPKMAAALETGTTSDGRTRAALAKRGLITVAEDKTFTVTPEGAAAAKAALEAVA